MLKLAVNGAAGRMGRRIIGLVAESSRFQLVCALEQPEHPEIGTDAGKLAGAEKLGVNVTPHLSGGPDVLIDFSAPKATLRRARECADAKIGLVIGTTGLSAEQEREIETDIARSIPVLKAPNMGLGVNLLFGLVQQVAAALGDDYDVEIIESHHRRKKDAPSGTAGELAKNVCEALGWDADEALTYGREGLTGERPTRQLCVHAVRGGDIVGEHTVLFAGEGERIELTHRASSRDLFARGSLRAARFVAEQPPGSYDMQDVLF
jgi:4-hydroxy-tetrahydrodipicolinate reductase